MCSTLTIEMQYYQFRRRTFSFSLSTRTLEMHAEIVLTFGTDIFLPNHRHHSWQTGKSLTCCLELQKSAQTFGFHPSWPSTDHPLLPWGQGQGTQAGGSTVAQLSWHSPQHSPLKTNKIQNLYFIESNHGLISWKKIRNLLKPAVVLLYSLRLLYCLVVIQWLHYNFCT